MLDAGVDGVAPGRRPGRVMLRPETVVVDLALTMLLGLAGAVGAWLLRRRTSLSARNLYPPAAAGALLLAGAIGLAAWNVALVLLPLVSPWVAGAVVGARWRSSDLGAGEELRNHELGRRWIWQPAAERRHGERLYLRSQGELVRERPWPRSLAYVSMTGMGNEGPRLPLGAGQHVVLFGGECHKVCVRQERMEPHAFNTRQDPFPASFL